jgi:hypothetical protein
MHKGGQIGLSGWRVGCGSFYINWAEVSHDGSRGTVKNQLPFCLTSSSGTFGVSLSFSEDREKRY